jgi:hypothetical protein
MNALAPGWSVLNLMMLRLYSATTPAARATLVQRSISARL